METMPSDPLQELQDPDHPTWLYLEWIENGTLNAFIEKASRRLHRLPNRLLWRFFLCLLRMCIAMAWPPGKPADNSPVVEVIGGGRPGALHHGDFHDGNVMIGAIEMNPEETEHDLVPMLKLIDWGAASNYDESSSGAGPATGETAVTENIYDVGKLMAELATLDQDLSEKLYPERGETRDFQISAGGKFMRTTAVELLPSFGLKPLAPHLDELLRSIICACLASEPSNRPSLGGLVTLVSRAVSERDVEYYWEQARQGRDINPYEETYEEIQWLIRNLLLDADT